MSWKKRARALLFPPLGIMLLLVPVATVFLVYSMLFLGSGSPTAIVSYVLAAYALTVWCLKLPHLVRFFKIFKAGNRHIQRWLGDEQWRINVSLYGTLLWNTAYAVLQLGLGFWHHTFWYYSLAGYYLSLAVMRFFLVRHTRRHGIGENMRAELIRYRACGWVFLATNLSLSLIIFFMVYWDRTFHHHEITTIAMAAYTFTSLTLAVRSMVKHRRHSSPVFAATKAIGLSSACVSMLTLECTMLTTFDQGELDVIGRRLLLGLSGGAVSVLIVVMAVYMIVRSSRALKTIGE